MNMDESALDSNANALSMQQMHFAAPAKKKIIKRGAGIINCRLINLN